MMSLAEKIAAAAAQAQRSEAEAYSTLEMILRERPMDDWLKRVCADVDGLRDRPVNLEADHG